MGNFFTDNQDLRFYVERGIDWAALAEVGELGFRAPEGFKGPGEALQFYREVAEMLGQLAADEVAPRAAAIDREGAHLHGGEARSGPAMEAIFESLRQAELHKLCLPRELGGLNAPLVVYFLGAEMLARGDVSTMTHFSFHGGMAMAMLVFSIHEDSTVFDAAGCRIAETRFAEEIAEIARGEAWGAMDITEPNAGSDMAALRTAATQDASGKWVVSGEKIFITSGHAKYHFVIARTDGEGLEGLSMFLVKAVEDGTRRVGIDRVEEKLGHHGSVTAALSFDRAPAQLIGKRGEGFKYMLVLMNNARVGVGFESIGLCEAAYRMARAYAEQRQSMGKPIGRHEMIADYLDEMRTDIQGLRALAVASAFHEEMSHKLGLWAKLGGPEREAEIALHRARARRFTPLLKYLGAEKAVEIARRNMQIHGGIGYMSELGADKLLRDAMVLPVYEGTSQIQSLMAMKDTLGGIIKKPQAFLSRVGQAKWRSSTARDPLERRVAKVQSLSLSAQQFLMTRTAAGKLRTLAEVPVVQWREALGKQWDPKRDFALAMLHAERLTRILADEAISELLLEQARAFPERRALCERWLERAELRVRAVHEELTRRGGRILEELSEPAPADSATA